jgi:hypothetical protein
MTFIIYLETEYYILLVERGKLVDLEKLARVGVVFHKPVQMTAALVAAGFVMEQTLIRYVGIMTEILV